MEFNRKVVLKDGREFYGKGFGSSGSGVFELVFNTSMVGYQEIISDPTNYNQMVLMTYPLIGNYGITDEDFESKAPKIGALVVREYNDSPSNFRYTKTLSEELEENNIPGICELDTRKLTKIIREEGTQPALLLGRGAQGASAAAARALRVYGAPDCQGFLGLPCSLRQRLLQRRQGLSAQGSADSGFCYHREDLLQRRSLYL